MDPPAGRARRQARRDATRRAKQKRTVPSGRCEDSLASKRFMCPLRQGVGFGTSLFRRIGGCRGVIGPIPSTALHEQDPYAVVDPGPLCAPRAWKASTHGGRHRTGRRREAGPHRSAPCRPPRDEFPGGATLASVTGSPHCWGVPGRLGLGWPAARGAAQAIQGRSGPAPVMEDDGGGRPEGSGAAWLVRRGKRPRTRRLWCGRLAGSHRRKCGWAAPWLRVIPSSLATTNIVEGPDDAVAGCAVMITAERR